MKKVLSILFAFLILLSGMHLSIASHICGGEVAAMKFSFSEKKATCGMESQIQECSNHNSISSNCCKDLVKVYSVDNNYNSSVFQVKELTNNLLQIYTVPVSTIFHSLITAKSLCNYIIPPDIGLTSAVSLADICVFRI
jgi:hypothetical protein